MDSLELGGNNPIYSFLTSAIASGKALADDGKAYDSVQNAVDNASGLVIVGPGTFNESITISTAGLTLIGVGEDTIINGTGLGDAVNSTANNVTVKNLTVQTDSSYNGVTLAGDNSTVQNVSCIGGESGVYTTGSGCIVTNCKMTGASSYGVWADTARTIISSCVVDGDNQSTYCGLFTRADDCIISNCVVFDAGTPGIQLGRPDNICIGNRVINAGDNGIYLSGADDSLAANNRVSDSTNADISTANSSGSVLDDNKTGASN